MRIPKLWEPEEFVGSGWDHLVKNTDTEPHYAESKVFFEEVRNSVSIINRALGGDPTLEITGAASNRSAHRTSRRSKIARMHEQVTYAQYDRHHLLLPASIDIFEDRDLARGLYNWMAAIVVYMDFPERLRVDPFQHDIIQLQIFAQAERRLLQACPGFMSLRRRLGATLLENRPEITLLGQEKVLEVGIRELIKEPGGSDSLIHSLINYDDQQISAFKAESGYRTFRPVFIWPQLVKPRSVFSNAPNMATDQNTPATSQETKRSIRVSRKTADQAERKDSFILHRFESILSMIDFLNINRHVDEDDADDFRKSAGDEQDASFVNNSKSPKTKLKFHLDLAPQDVEKSQLIGECLYPEWDWISRSYLPDHVHVEERKAAEASIAPLDKVSVRRQISAVKRQFEALRPRRSILRRQIYGDDLDLDEIIRARCDAIASGNVEDRLYRATRNAERDLAVSVLFDTSRSTEAVIEDRSINDIGKEALVAFIEGISACGDDVSAHAFSSLNRERVMITTIKSFEDDISDIIRRRIMAIRPSFYTRMGGAIRHVSGYLDKCVASRRLLILITDGRPNDLDHYEGRYGIEDTRRAVLEARRRGQAVFAVTIDARAHEYVPHIFGPSGFAIIPDARFLNASLPLIYSHLSC